MTDRPLFDPRAFRIPEGVVSLCAGGETPFLRRHDRAIVRYIDDKSGGEPGRVRQQAVVDRVRGAAARLWKVPPTDLGVCPSVADGVAMVAESLGLEPGETVYADAIEFPSLAGPFALDGRLRGTIDETTRVVVASAVSYLTGERFDLSALRARADAVGAVLIVDFTQASGWADIDASVADFAFSSCYKWMLGATGVALAYWNRARRPHWRPRSGGWWSLDLEGRPDWSRPVALRPDATVFTRGNPAFLPVYVLESALDYLLAFDPAEVERHVQGLGGYLLERLGEAGIEAMTPSAPVRRGASVCVAHDRACVIAGALHRRGVYGWNGDQRIRFSFHGYNARSDVDRLMDALLEEWT